MLPRGSRSYLLLLLLLAAAAIAAAAAVAQADPPHHSTPGQPEEKQDVLVLGGNGFMGVYAVESLVQTGRYNVAVANRNSSYSDSAERLAAAGVTTVHWDRRTTPFRDAPAMRAYFAAHPRLHAIVDFSCYTGEAARDVASFLLEAKGVHVTRYVYISSDSIYDVCAPKAQPYRPTEEGVDDTRPAAPEAQAALNAQDTYGHGKLEAEEVLRAMQPRSTWSYVFLRIPDVVGPRDTSFRWWLYQLLVKLQPRTGVPIPCVQADKDGRRLSLVYVGDVARAVVQLLARGDEDQTNVALNLAHHETWTFSEVMGSMAHALGNPQPLRFALNGTTDFPSVKKGPVSTARAQQVLPDWHPTPWAQVVAETVHYYESPSLWHDPRFAKEIQGVLRMAHQQVAKYGQEAASAWRDALRAAYGVDVASVDLSGSWIEDSVQETEEVWSSEL